MKININPLASLAVIGFSLVVGAPRVAHAQTSMSMSGSNGNTPYAGVTVASNGDIYGTSLYGGTSSLGNIWKIAAGTSTITTVASFTGTNGQYPYGGVTIDSSGNLYGTTYSGGASSSGTVWTVTAGTSTITTIASFNGTNGANPYCSVTRDSSGNLYGTAYAGGANNCGVVWKIASGTSTLSAIDSFSYNTTGYGSYGGVSIDSSGNLYGTTYSGGASASGTIWKIASGTSTITTVASLTTTTGKLPQSSVTVDSSGNLYGVAASGGSLKYGTIWKVAAGTSTVTVVANFNRTNGSYPYGGVLVASNGNLYGTCYNGGTAGYGTVWKVASGTSTITTLVNFTGTSNGANPYGVLAADSSGNLWGTGSYGGSSSKGNVFKITNP